MFDLDGRICRIAFRIAVATPMSRQFQPRAIAIALCLAASFPIGCRQEEGVNTHFDPPTGGGPVQGPFARSNCGDFANACYDELSHIAVGQLLAFRPRSRWVRTNLTWAITKFLPENEISVQRQEKEVADAFALWALKTPLAFTLVAENENPDIRITFEPPDHGDGFLFDGPGGVRGHAFFPGSNRAGQIHLDIDEKWSLDPEPEKTHLFTVLVHEIGHGLGLEHMVDDNDSAQVGIIAMAPAYPESGGIIALAAKDISAIQKLYGSGDGTVSPEIGGQIPVIPLTLADENNPDTDGDGIPDTLEIFVFATNPGEPDSDADGADDFEELFRLGTPPTDAGDDSDADGLSDALEAQIGTRVNLDDTDGDQLSDGLEFFANTNPLARDTDGDGLLDGVDPLPTFDSCLFGSDCNGNGIPDPCDVRDGVSDDENANGIPDECDECVRKEDCDDLDFCNGLEDCVGAKCREGRPPCGTGTVCNQLTEQCEAP